MSDAAIAVITLDNPPVNALSYALRARVIDELTRAEEDPAVRAIVVTGSHGFFSGGADVKEFNTAQALADPNLFSMITRFEQCAKPTLAAISGTCLGGGFELALGCHFRIAAAEARVGLPEVKIGLIPGAGGTQRLPRVAGLEIATNMIIAGEPVRAADLSHTALFDRVVEGDPLPAAKLLAQAIIADSRPLRRIRDMPLNYPNHAAFLAFARNMVKAKAGPYPAPLAALEAIGAGVDDFPAGLRREREIFLGLLQAPESRALRHIFFAERAASRIADVPADTCVRPIATVAVIGAGTMGGGIAMNFLNANIPVILVEQDQGALDRGVAAIRRNYESSARKGKLSAADLDARMSLLAATIEFSAIATADLVIEAVYEDMTVKQQVFRKLDPIAKPGAILATNTSTLDINKIAHVTQRPADVVGLHFFSPANVMRLLEVVRATATCREVLATVMQLARRIRKLAIVAAVCDGFIGNRMIHKYSAQAFALLEAGCLPAQVDQAMERFGLAMGPFRMSDLAGNDISWAIRKRRYAHAGGPEHPHLADRLCELGRFGQKTGAGWYDYLPGDRNPRPSAEVDALIERHSAELGIVRREINDSEIIERLIFSLVNEGAQILADGIAQRASDIDLVYLNGYGFPAWRGGPMFYADAVGLTTVVCAIRRYGNVMDPPAALLTRLASSGTPLAAFDPSAGRTV